MRFKAKLAPEQVSLLCALVGSVKRLYEGEGSKKDLGRSGLGTHLTGGSILRVDPHKLRLATTGKGDADGVAFFCELATHDGIFLEHRIDSAAEDNAIAMEISLGELRVALRSIVANLEHHGFRSGGVAGGEDNINIRHSTTVVKLAKRDNIPCLCFDAFTRDGVVAVHHSIPVRIVRVPDADHMIPPVSFPDLNDGVPIGIDRNLRIILERLQSECPHVYLQTSPAGELALRADSESSCVRTFFGKTPSNRNPASGNREHCSLKVDTKMLVGCLQWQQSAIASNVANAIMSFAEDDMLVVHVTLNPGSLGFFTYNLPVQYMAEDDP